MAEHESDQERHQRGGDRDLDTTGVQRGAQPDVPPDPATSIRNDLGTPEGRDQPPANRGRDPHSPWLGGG